MYKLDTASPSDLRLGVSLAQPTASSSLGAYFEESLLLRPLSVVSYIQQRSSSQHIENAEQRWTKRIKQNWALVRRRMIVPPQKSSRALKSSTKQKSASKSANPNLGSHHATRNIAVMHNEINILTDVDILILSVGLCYVGYDTKRQISCNIDRNMKRFKSFYGPDPTTIVPLFKDL